MPFPILAAAGALIEFAPDIARWIGGDDAGDAADKVVGLAQKVTGAGDPQSAVDMIKANPEMAMAFEKSINDHKAEMDQMYLKDRGDARQRDIAIQDKRGRNTRADVLAFSAIGGLISLIWILLFIQIPDGPARDVLLLLSGALITIVKDVYGFEFGSSRGSKDKDGLIGAFKK